MKFPLATIALTSSAAFYAASALPTTDPQSSPILDDQSPDFNATSDDVEARGLFTTYPCKLGVKVKLYKDWACHGSATRTDIVNWPFPAGYLDRCQEVTSKSDMKGLTFQGPADALRVSFYSEPGCKGGSYPADKYLCSSAPIPKTHGGVADIKPIKSFRVTAIDTCRSHSEDGQ